MICCVCLWERCNVINIFDGDGKKLNIAQILAKHLWFEPSPKNSISSVICCNCWEKLHDFHQFYTEVEQAHTLQTSTNIANLCEVNIKNNTSEEKPEATEVEKLEADVNIKEELVDNVWQINYVDDNATYSTKIELNPLEVLDAKLEFEEQEKNFDCCTEDSDERDTEFKVETSDTEATDEEDKQKLSRVLAESSAQKAVKRTKRKKKVIANEENGDHAASSVSKTVSSKKSKQQRQRLTARDEELVKKYITMGCELCPYVGEDFTELAEHFRIEHDNLKPYVMCCGRKLNKRFLVVHHAYKHEDPEYYKCKECNKVFSDGYILRSHMLANHAAAEDLQYACDLCPKRFSRLYFLKLHKPSHIPPEEFKFQCSKCPTPKFFASDHLLQIHTSMRHTRATNVCHVCAKEIRDKQAFEKHVRLHFEDSGPRIKCPHPDCDSYLKDNDNLKQHLRRHNDTGKSFICKHCNKACKNRRSLTSHINYVHNNETFSCESCNKTFKKAITLREHMAQHTGERLYKCPFCPRTFNSNANMHSHKKKMHPEEWDIWRKTKKGSSQRPITELAKEANSVVSTTNIALHDNIAFNDSMMLQPNYL